MIRILLAEDQAMMRDALAILLDLEEDMTVVARAGSGDGALAAAREHRPDVALIDIEMPGTAASMSRPSCGRRCRIAGWSSSRRSGGRAICVVPWRAERPGSWSRTARWRSWPRRSGGSSAESGSSTRRSPPRRSRPGASPLTARERDVLAASADGSPLSEVAARLRLSQSTVRNYLSSAIGKTGARNRVEAVRVVTDNGWL